MIKWLGMHHDSADDSLVFAAWDEPSTMPQSPTTDDGSGSEPIVPRDSQDVVNAINQRIFDTSLDLILVVDRRGTFIRVSPSAQTIIGYSPGELIGHNARGILYPPDLDNTRNEMRLARAGRVMRNFECRYLHKDGHIVPLSWMGVWSEPEERHFFIGRDITERHAADLRLRQAQRMDAIGQLTGGMAHDFNNLLGIIIGNLDLLRLTGSLPAENDELVGEALSAAVRGADLTRRLLAFARRQPLQPERIDINDMVSNIVGLLGRTLGEHIPISVNLTNNVWPIVVDPAQLEASLVNLATNARDAMPRGGRLMITTENHALDAEYVEAYADLAAGDYVVVGVSDTGTGIPPEVMSRVFEPFFTTKEQGKGTGLGLSMVFGFAKQSGGHINVYSELGKGTTFRIYLPRDLTGVEVAPRPPAALPAAGGNESVLVVDDNEAIRRVVRRQLTALGYRVIEADTAAAALRQLAAEEITLLFTDVIMPGNMDGIELARTAMERWPGLRVILTSGFPEARLSGTVEPIAGIRLLSKPYRRDDLARTVRDILDRPSAEA
ncbi:MAG TPA: ATP-binding protein [Stellaceae bacterium]|nr:ATP-binding protein [Stellaceae bacterium]